MQPAKKYDNMSLQAIELHAEDIFQTYLMSMSSLIQKEHQNKFPKGNQMYQTMYRVSDLTPQTST
jgi:hypothetical protein